MRLSCCAVLAPASANKLLFAGGEQSMVTALATLSHLESLNLASTNAVPESVLPALASSAHSLTSLNLRRGVYLASRPTASLSQSPPMMPHNMTIDTACAVHPPSASRSCEEQVLSPQAGRLDEAVLTDNLVVARYLRSAAVSLGHATLTTDPA